MSFAGGYRFTAIAGRHAAIDGVGAANSLFWFAKRR